MPNKKTINFKRRKSNRKQTPQLERLSSLLIVLLLTGFVAWILSQRDNFNPADRDYIVSNTDQRPKPIELYHQPMKYWSEAGTQTAGIPKADITPYPESVLKFGWRLKRPMQTFTPDNLYEKINGEAELFIKLGFQQLYYIQLINDKQEEITIELYDQNDIMGSMAIFNKHLIAGKPLIKSEDVVYFKTSVGSIGRNGHFFFRIAGRSDYNTITTQTDRLAVALKDLPKKAAAVPLPFQILTQKLQIHPSRVVLQGQNVFQYDFAKNFWFGSPDAAKNTRLYIHQSINNKKLVKVILH